MDGQLDPELFSAFSTELESRISAQFVNDKLNIWRDKDGLLTGVNWNATIEASLRESKLLIVMLSPKWLGSDYCLKEFTIFREVERQLGMETLGGDAGGVTARTFRCHGRACPGHPRSDIARRFTGRA